MKDIEEKWEIEFDKQFQGFMSLGDENGGYDPRPYIKNFILHLLQSARAEAHALGKAEGKQEVLEEAIKELDNRIVLQNIYYEKELASTEDENVKYVSFHLGHIEGLKTVIKLLQDLKDKETE